VPSDPKNGQRDSKTFIEADTINALLRNLQDNGPVAASEAALNLLSYRDFPKLQRAQAGLTVKSRDKKIDVVFRSRINAMAATLNLYLDPELSYTWRQASNLAARAAGKSLKFARKIREWIHSYLHHQKLPMHRYGCFHSSILDDEDIQQAIQLQLLEKASKAYICAQDLVDIVKTLQLQELLGLKGNGTITAISIRTAQRWLRKHDWRYGRPKKGMYIDGHEREDIVKYRNEFIQRWKEYEKRMVIYDNNGNIATTPRGFKVPNGRFRLVLVTHDESTFYANDRRKTKWTHASEKAVPERKGEGSSLMVSDFLTPEWGRLMDDHE
jgi:hypothetical protein